MNNGLKQATNILDSEMFGNAGRHYFLDIKKTRINASFLQITQINHGGDATFKRTQVIFFEEDLPFFIEALSMLLGRFSHGQQFLIN